MYKVKILMLGTSDNNYEGHVKKTMYHLPDYFDPFMVTLEGLNGKTKYNIYDANSILYRAKRKLNRKISDLKLFFKLREIPKLDESHPEYCYLGNELNEISVDKILNLLPDSFWPDIISIHWCSNFITSKTIRELYERTQALIVWHLTDESPFTGGCHYPVDCKAYLSSCENCPALIKGKRFSTLQLESKKTNLKDIPIVLVGTSYDLKLAKQTPLFYNSKFIPCISRLNIDVVDKALSRNELMIPEDRFVIMVAASEINNPRKGIIYSVEAIKYASKNISNLTVLVLGNKTDKLLDYLKGIDVMYLGFVNEKKMILSFCASDIFMSTSIADSGPMMINYSMECYTPVVSFNVGIADDLVITGKTGYKGEFKNSKDLAHGIMQIYNLSADERQKMRLECKSNLIQKSSNNWYDEIADMVRHLEK